MKRIYINNDWKFSTEFVPGMENAGFDESALETVRLPHSCANMPFHYFDEHAYQMLCGYRKTFTAPSEWQGKRVFLTFEGVAHAARVFLNGKMIGEHRCGYTSFSLELTKDLLLGESNVIAVEVDSRENLNIPPFGYVIDYMTFGGIYREAYLEVAEQSYIKDVFNRSILPSSLRGEEKSDATIKSNVVLDGTFEAASYSVRQTIYANGDAIASVSAPVDGSELSFLHEVHQVKLWSLEHPTLHEVKTELMYRGQVVDQRTDILGIRLAKFEEDGFYLNGVKTKIRGLNRHQSYPYVGYAMPENMQRQDADILKYELGCNAARTSHYPQSHYFIDECDRIGLLVFMEFPGWQHIGNEEWKEQACQNAREMITEFRNHPSIILWGVRINESKDDDAFYLRTNAIAHELDDSRPTGGVRCFKKSNLLEDVYTYNDFSYDGSNAGCDKKRKVTPDMKKAYFISEYNGHMFPTKAFDWEEKRVEHALRHATVLDAIAENDDIAGGFGWCMFDYNTHKDFGSGDRICYHGVMDMFRNPKLASIIYAMQQDEEMVLELSSSMDIGEHPGCNRGLTYILTNADAVRMYKNGTFIKEYKPSDSPFKHLKHGPIVIDDFIGDEIAKHEKFKKHQAEVVKNCLNETALYGYRPTKKVIWNALQAILLYHMSFGDAYSLFGKYIGDWGGTSTEYRFEAIKDGQVVKTMVKCPMTKTKLVALPNTSELKETSSYDVMEVRLYMKDENENLLSFYNDSVVVSTEGPIELIGPSVVGLQGGMAGIYVKTIGECGKASITVTSTSGEKVDLAFEVTADKCEQI